MRDIWIYTRCLRIFWRGFQCPQGPYGFHQWGFYGFGIGPVGFMFWPHPETRHSTLCRFFDV
jgi:hypothetical protein